MSSGLLPLEVPLEGTQLIEASAGTGKTYTIAFLYLRLIVEKNLPVEQILVVTFTRAATAELADRLRSRLREALSLLDLRRGVAEGDVTLRTWLDALPDKGVARQRLAEALHGMDAAAISTIHGFCGRMLQEFAFESGARLDTDVLDDERPLVRQAVEDFWASHAATAPPQLVRHLVSRRVGPDQLLESAMMALGDPTVPVLPPVEHLDADDEAAMAAVAAWKQAHEAARQVWWTERDEWMKRMTRAIDDGVLSKRSYTTSKLWSWRYDIDRLFTEETTGPAGLFDDLRRFTPEALAANTRKGREADLPQLDFFDAVGRLVAAYDATRAPVQRWEQAFRRRMIEAVRARVAAAKERARAVSFTDLLHRLDAALEHPVQGPKLARRIRDRYPAALIDEFQDTDPVQYRIFHRVHGGDDAVLFLIGDPKQAIYGFRGADIQAYLEAREHTSQQHTLTVNYRSDPGVVLAIDALYRGHPAPFADRRIPFVHDVTAREGADNQLRYANGSVAFPMRVVFVPRDHDGRSERKPHRSGTLKSWYTNHHLPMQVADEVVRLLQGHMTLPGEGGARRPVGPGDIAILVRSNWQARTLHQALAQRAVPAALQSDASVLDTDEAGEMAALVAALADPTDPVAVRGALATRALGLSGEALAVLRDDEEAWERWVERFQRWSAQWVRSSFLMAFRQLLEDCDVPRRLLSQPSGERALTNLLHLGELLQRLAAERRLHRAGLLHWLASMRADAKLVRAELGSDADPIRLESDSGAVTLVTMHRAKGLEYPIVFLPFLGTGLFPPGEVVRFHDEQGRLTLDAGSADFDEHVQRARRDELAEALRLLYVALTRAKHHVVLYWGAFAGFDSSPLGWLLHGAELPEGAGPEALEALLDGISDEELCARLKELEQATGQAITPSKLIESKVDPWEPPAAPPMELTHHAPLRTAFPSWRVGSFSALVGGHEAPEGHDHDAVEALPGGGEGPVVPLADWPRGAAPGTAMHAVLEVLDFAAGREARVEVASEQLARHGVAPRWVEPLVDGLDAACHVPLGAGEPSLAMLGRADRLDELAFTFPVAPSGRRFDAEALADCFARHATDPRVLAYAPRLAQLGFAPLQGFLKGFVDLVYRHEGRYGVVDYKSNHLGERLGDYGPEALTRAMVHHHYVLQYHLYLVALHRMLTARVPGYRYERDVVGARYLFLRGMVPAGGQGWGVWADRPPVALIDALDRCLAGGADVR
jgi:exodeoxyribonuclease V beta subunit